MTLTIDPVTITAHPETAVSFGAFGQRRPYFPNYRFAGEYIDDFHASLGNCEMDGVKINIGISGWLRRADALKLYECGHFAKGDILEFGTNRGLSAYILANSIKMSGRSAKLVTLELFPELAEAAEKTLKSKGVSEFVEFCVGDADASCARLLSEKRRFGFAFIDHSHAYEHVVSACKRLKQLVDVGAICVFHDYNDARNTRAVGVGESGSEYGVVAGIEDGLDHTAFRFIGVYGCCGVFQRVA